MNDIERIDWWEKEKPNQPEKLNIFRNAQNDFLDLINSAIASNGDLAILKYRRGPRIVIRTKK